MVDAVVLPLALVIDSASFRVGNPDERLAAGYTRAATAPDAAAAVMAAGILHVLLGVCCRNTTAP